MVQKVQTARVERFLRPRCRRNCLRGIIWWACSLLTSPFRIHILVFPFFHLLKAFLAGILGGKNVGTPRADCEGSSESVPAVSIVPSNKKCLHLCDDDLALPPSLIPTFPRLSSRWNQGCHNVAVKRDFVKCLLTGYYEG